MNTDCSDFFTPVIIPTLCRFNHFKSCLESLSQCSGAESTEVFIGLDYPAKDSHWNGYILIKNYLESVKLNFKKLHIFKREYNYGSIRNSNELRDFVKNKYGKFIYSEDDNIFSPNFLIYMNTCLKQYKNDPKIFAICGYTMPVNWKTNDNNHFATRFIRAWGFGSWSNKFSEYRSCCNGKWIYDFLFKKQNTGNENFFQLERNDYGIWRAAIKHLHMRCIHYGDMMMYAYLLGTNRYVICPSISMVKNIGFDSTGEHYTNAPEWLIDNPISTDTDFILNGNPYSFVEENERRRRLFEKKINRLTMENFRPRLSFLLKIALKVFIRGSKYKNW